MLHRNFNLTSNANAEGSALVDEASPTTVASEKKAGDISQLASKPTKVLKSQERVAVRENGGSELSQKIFNHPLSIRQVSWKHGNATCSRMRHLLSPALFPVYTN